MSTTSDRALYTVREFCRRNSIGKTTFFALVKSGAIATVHVGSRTLVPAESEKAWHETLVRPVPKPVPKSVPKSGVDWREPRRTVVDRG